MTVLQVPECPKLPGVATGIFGSHEFAVGLRLSLKVEARLPALVTRRVSTQKHDARPTGARLKRTLVVPGSLKLHRRPRRVTDVTAGAVPAASPQTSARASAPSCRLR